MRWRPLATEFLVGDAAVGVGTELDGVWVAKDGTLHFVELKTGYADDRDWYDEAGRMHGDLGRVLGDSTVNRAIVQCVAGALMAIETLQLNGAFACWVVRTNDSGTDIVPIASDLLYTIGPIIRDMLATHQQGRRRRPNSNSRRRRPTARKQWRSHHVTICSN